MAVRTPTELKSFFEQGDFPTEAQFVDLIDSITSGGNFLPYTGATSNTDTGVYTLTTTSLSSPLLIGGTGVTSNLTYKSTTGAGTTTVVAHSFVGGNNGATNLLTLLNNGKMGLNSATPPYPLTNSQGVTGFTTTYANYTNSQIASDVTDAAWIHITTPTTQATAFTLNTLVHYGASAVTVGAGSTVTNNVGFFASSGLSGGTNNYGFQSSLIAALTSYNIYADGTAKNYFAGNVGMGTTTPTAYLHIKAGTDAASTAPIKLTTGTVNTAAEAGTIEYNNTFHVTNSDATRRHIATAPNATKVTAAAPYTNDGYILINIGGTDFKVMTTV